MPAVQAVPVRPRPTVSSPGSLAVDRYAPALGATISGIDLNRDFGPGVEKQLRQALLDHGVLFFRDQQLTPERFLDIARVFGKPLRHNPYLPSVAEHSGVEIIESGGGKRILANEAWHADVTWQPDPPKATALYAVELPPLGGDTVWSSSAGAHAALDPLLAAYLETLTAVNFVDANGHARVPGQDEYLHDLRVKYPPIDVPVIHVHAETGQKTVFVTELHTTYIKGVSRTTSESLLRLLFGVLADPLLHARFTWRPGSLAVWDNRLVQHRAIHDYGLQRRVLYRATLA